MTGYITTEQMFDALSAIPGRQVKLSDAQRNIIAHGNGPLWVIAGPGSGKTEVLVLRCLKLILVDGVNPKSILITTFTEKAARSLQDRIANYKTQITTVYPRITDIDLFQLRAGTLHSLCNDIMIETRYPAYKNCRPLDDIEQLMFIYFHSNLVITPTRQLTQIELKLWERFDYAWTTNWRAKSWRKNGWAPSKWMRARACQLIFNRIVEDFLDVERMVTAGGEWRIFAESYLQYKASLQEFYRVDFPHMQSKFLEFLDTPLGQQFVEGGGGQPGISYILVDEYQDTNPIQEAIYLRIARKTPHNLCVVGDDDQALYRFRGGTVECMINFGNVCKREFGIDVQTIPLVENYRSHPIIVQWVNDYIESFEVMKHSGARAPGKPRLLAKSKIKGNWPAVGLLSASNVEEVAQQFADIVHHLISKKIVNRPSECVLLLRSTRETKTYAGPFVQALRQKGVPVYNPRSRQFLEHEEIQLALGAFLEVVDQERDYATVPRETRDTCDSWREFYETQSRRYRQLEEYVARSQKVISSLTLGQELDLRSQTAQDILYHILNLPPFTSWTEDPERTVRLGELTRLIEAFSSSPVPGYPGLSRGTLRASRSKSGCLSWGWRQQFYDSFTTLIIEEGLNDPEDEEVLYPPDRMPFMTVHQSKGLEFPFVFVTKLDDTSQPDYQHIMEEDFRRFSRSTTKLPPADERARQDLIRFFYVAYSRAKYALILATTDKKIVPGEDAFVAFGGKDNDWLKERLTKLN